MAEMGERFRVRIRVRIRVRVTCMIGHVRDGREAHHTPTAFDF